MKKQPYSKEYFQTLAAGSMKSAQLTIPVIYSYIQPKSVVDVGCGIGTWLKIWQQLGVNDFLGIDGEYVQNSLVIPPENFLKANLQEKLILKRKFDLAMCLEVAEHVPSRYATNLIDSLCSLSEVIVFSAAIPGQGGYLHYNEQYPQYWAELFAQNGFTGYDCLRPKIWMMNEIDGCYKQNIFFFVKGTSKEKYALITSTATSLFPLVHPHILISKNDEIESYKRTLSTPFHAAWYFIKRYFPLFGRKKVDL